MNKESTQTTMLIEKKDMAGEKNFDPFQVMDYLDDRQILAELEGRIIDKWVYHFPQEGQEIWGLSKVGVDMACREMARMGEALREEEVKWEVDPTDNNFVLFKAYALRVVVAKDGTEIALNKAIGTKRQCRFIMAKGVVSARLNNFWFEQGSMKALRNAKQRLISEEIRAKIIAMAKEKGKIKEIKFTS